MNHGRAALLLAFALFVSVTAIPWSDWPSGNCRADQLGELTQPIAGRPMRASSGEFDPESNRDCHHPQPGQSLVVADLEGPGEIRHLWFTIASRDRRYPRKLVLRVFYDGSDVPSVETPIGDFFAAGNGMRANVKTKPIEVSSYGRALNCYWRMPFKKSCRVEVQNQSDVRMSVYFQCDWLKLDSLPEDTLYFHARYRQEYPAKPFSWYTVFEGEGRGHYVGTVFSAQNTLPNWFGEADDRFYIDGEEVPSIVGTGAEDYFNDAWNLRLTSGDRVGTTICEPTGDQRRITAYRWHIDDPIPFTKSIKFELERRSYIGAVNPETGQFQEWGFKYRPDYWSTVAFWYQDGIAKPKWEFPPVEQRVLEEVWIDPAWSLETIRASEGLRYRQRSNRTCNQKRCLSVDNDRVGAWFELPFTIKTPGLYAASIFPNLYKEHGVWKISLIYPNGRQEVLDKAFDFFDHYFPQKEDWPENHTHGTTRELKLGEHKLVPGEYAVRFECVGANPMSRHPRTGEFGKGYGLRLDSMSFRRLPIEDAHEWIQDYLKREEVLFAGFVKEAKETVEKLDAAVRAFERDRGRYPKKLDELVGTPYWKGQRIPLDPWHQPYRYRCPGVVRPWDFDVYSVHGDSKYPASWFGNWENPLSIPGGINAIAHEGENLKVKQASPGVRASRLHHIPEGIAPLSGERMLFLPFGKPGDAAEIELPADIPNGRYKVYVFTPTSWDFGVCQWSLNGVSLGEPFDAETPTRGMKSLPAAVVELKPGPRILRVEAVGKSKYSTGYKAGLDAIVLAPLR